MLYELEQISYYHSLFKREKQSLKIEIKDDYNVNQYHPINLPALFDALLNYLNIHDILKFSMISKSFRLGLKNKKINIRDDYVKNAADHCCIRCVQWFYTRSHIPMLYQSCCESGNKKLYKLISNQYNFSNITDNDYIYDCVKNIIKHDAKTIKRLLKPLYHYHIKDVKTLSLIVQTKDEDYLKLLCLNSHNLSRESFLVLLPHFCCYDLAYKISDHFNMIIKEDLPYIYELLNNNYNRIVKKILLIILLKNHYPFDVLEWAHQYDYGEVWKYVFTYPINLKTVVEKGYEYNLLTHYDLDNTKEENILSIRLSSKYTIYEQRPIYTSHLTVQEIIEQLFISSKRIQVKLIEHLCQRDLHHENLVAFIEWIVNHHNSEGLALMDKINENLKIKLVPLAYYHQETITLDFLEKSKTLNLLSIAEADKYSVNNYIYVNHLNNEDLLKLLVKVQNKYIKKVLIYHLKLYNIKIEKRTIYKVGDEYYKLKINTDTIKNIEKCIHIDENTYEDILNELSIKFDYSQVYIIEWMVKHPLFKTVYPLNLLKSVACHISVVNEILTHPFFDQYRV